MKKYQQERTFNTSPVQLITKLLSMLRSASHFRYVNATDYKFSKY